MRLVMTCFWIYALLFAIGCKNSNDSFAQKVDEKFENNEKTTSQKSNEELSVIIDGLNYRVNVDNHTAELVSCEKSVEIAIIPLQINFKGQNYAVTKIGEKAFYGNINLKEIELSENIKQIGADAFFFCKSVKNIKIPAHVDSIGENAFSLCKGLNSITVSEQNINYVDLDGVLFTKNMNVLIQYPIGSERKNYTIPLGTEIIGRNAFDNSSNLISVTIPKSVKELGYQCFNGSSIRSLLIPGNVKKVDAGAFMLCKELKSLTIEDGVEEIGAGAFNSCTGLSHVVLPKSLTTIGENAFVNCALLQTIKCEAVSPPCLSTLSPDKGILVPKIISEFSDVCLLVPGSSVEQYKSALGWKEFKTIKSY